MSTEHEKFLQEISMFDPLLNPEMFASCNDPAKQKNGNQNSSVDLLFGTIGSEDANIPLNSSAENNFSASHKYIKKLKIHELPNSGTSGRRRSFQQVGIRPESITKFKTGRFNITLSSSSKEESNSNSDSSRKNSATSSNREDDLLKLKNSVMPVLHKFNFQGKIKGLWNNDTDKEEIEKEEKGKEKEKFKKTENPKSSNRSKRRLFNNYDDSSNDSDIIMLF